MIQTVLILALGTIIAAIIYTFLNGSKQKRKEIVIPLQDLSRIWVVLNKGMEEKIDEDIEKEQKNLDPDRETLVDITPNDNPEPNPEPKPEVKPNIKPDDNPIIDTTFYEECIAPYMNMLKAKNLDIVVKKLLTILDKYKDTSSIVQKPYDEEAGDLYIILDAIKSINIRDHTYSVTRILIDSIKDAYPNYKEIMPIAIIAGLAHDLGKIKELTNKEENHSTLSVQVFAEIVNEIMENISEDKQPNKTILELAVQAIKNHHTQTTNQLTTLLKKADQTARGYELMLRAKGMKVMSFYTWFNVEKYISSYIVPEINVTQGNTCRAFSYNGVVYVRTEYLHEAAYRMCTDLKIIDTFLLYESEKQNVIRKIVTTLNDAGYIHDMLQSPRISMKFELVMKMGGPKKNILTLTPLKSDSFDLQNLEQKKTDFLIHIEDVKKIEK